MEHFLLQLFIYLTAAAIAVPFAKKLGLGCELLVCTHSHLILFQRVLLFGHVLNTISLLTLERAGRKNIVASFLAEEV